MSRARPYLPLATSLGWEPEAARRGVSKVARSARGFMRAYEKAGSAKRLPEAWKRKREGFVSRHVAQAERAGEPWFEPDGSPTRRHLALIMWAYSPEPGRLAKRNPVGADVLRRTSLWHGTNQSAWTKIAKTGVLSRVVPEGKYGKKGKAKAASLADRVYVSNDPMYAAIYAVGGAYLGSELPSDRWTNGRYGYLLRVEPDEGADVVVDEDQLGELAVSGRLPWLYRQAEYVSKNKPYGRRQDLWGAAKFGEYSAWIRLGKLLIKSLTDEQMRLVAEHATQFAVRGTVRVAEAWRIDKSKTKKIKNADDLFSLSKRVFPKSNPLPDTDYVYHATRKSNLPSIRKNGLVPSGQPPEHSDEQRGTDEAVVFFAPTEDHARVWGEVVLRFPWPDDYEDDPYSDTTWVKGIGVVASAMFTWEAIPPGLIEVRSGKSWKPLVSKRSAYRASNPVNPFGGQDKATKRAMSRILEKNEPLIAGIAEHVGMPMPHGDPFGCGFYGCVYPTSDAQMVFKLTSDPSEIGFVEFAKNVGSWPEGIVRYYATTGALPNKYRKQDVQGLWREGAVDTGLYVRASDDRLVSEENEILECANLIGRVIYSASNAGNDLRTIRPGKRPTFDDSMFREILGPDHRRTFEIYQKIEASKGQQQVRLAIHAYVHAAKIMSRMPLLRSIGDAILFYLRHGLLISDLHSNNFGLVQRRTSEPFWVIIDPGRTVGVNPAFATFEKRSTYGKDNPRAIPISPKLYEKASKRMVAAASRLLKTKTSDTAFENAGQIIFRNLHGKRMVVTLQAFAFPASQFKGEPYEGPYLGGGFLITQDAPSEAKGALFLEFRMPPKGTKPPTKQQLETLLSRPIRHELTHAVDPQTLHHYHAVLDSVGDKARGKPSRYEDDPIEVKAFQREVIDEVFRALPTVLATPSPSTILERALDASPIWSARSAGMSERNRKRVLQAVYRAVAEEGIDPAMRTGGPSRPSYSSPNPWNLDRDAFWIVGDESVDLTQWGGGHFSYVYETSPESVDPDAESDDDDIRYDAQENSCASYAKATNAIRAFDDSFDAWKMDRSSIRRIQAHLSRVLKPSELKARGAERVYLREWSTGRRADTDLKTVLSANGPSDFAWRQPVGYVEENPCRTRYREPNPRVVQVDRERIKQIADTLTDRILQTFDDPDYADDPYPHGTVAMMPDVEMPIVSSFGGGAEHRRGEKLRRGPSTVKVDIWVRVSNDDRTYASIEGKTKAQHPQDYKAGYMPPYGLDIILELPGKVTKRSWKTLGSHLHDEVLRVLLHEATHFARLPWIRSKKSPRARRSQALDERLAITSAYLNDPEEIEARTQEIVQQAIEKIGRTPPRVRLSMRAILNHSPAWEEIEPYLTEENQRKVVQKVYRELSEVGLAPTRGAETEIMANPVAPDLGLSSVTENGVTFETGRPVEFRFVHGKIPAPNFGAKFQQDIEPAGRYLVHQPEGLGIFGRPTTDRVRREYEDGTVRFERPLVLRFTDDPDTLYGPTSWKARLRTAFKAKGKALSRKLAAAGYDGIVTVWEVHGKGSHTKEIVDLTMFAPRRNPILARPPMQMHALQGGGRHFAEVIGRQPGPDDYFGVHTTDDFAVAMTYARNAVDKESDPDAYPVVVSICVDGLEELPDVDAIVKATEASQSLRAYADEDVESQAESWEPEHLPPQPGDDPYYEYVDAMLANNNLAEAFLEAADDPQEAWDAWRETGEVPGPVASALVRQRRWASDIDLDRVVQIDAVKPIWTKLLDDWWNSGNEQAKAMAAELESKGWEVATIEHIIEGALPTDRKTLYRGGACGRVEYHGTSSTRLRMAFPDLALPGAPPFPTEQPDGGE